jgi:tetratricopeptide (TPR) repeat protein
LPEDTRIQREAELAQALEDLQAGPGEAEALIWAGRRHAYLGDYRQAIELFTRGVELHPTDSRFYRHRGHRFITVRELDRAIADFQRAAALIEGQPDRVEPDGQPNALGIPTSTLHFNIWYHYGLAHYLKGEFEEAADKYRRCMEVSEHPDSKVATAHWWYMTLRRLGRDREASTLLEGLDLDALAEGIIESGSYLALLRLYAGEGGQETGRQALEKGSLEGATRGYGLGNWYLYERGDTATAREIYREILSARDQWAAFGFIAAEADLARMDLRPPPEDD